MRDKKAFTMGTRTLAMLIIALVVILFSAFVIYKFGWEGIGGLVDKLFPF